MINKNFPNILGFTVDGTERKSSSHIQGNTVTESSQFRASCMDSVTLQSDVTFDVFGDQGTVKLTDTDKTKNLVFHVDSGSGSMSVANPSRDETFMLGDLIRVELDAGKFTAPQGLEESLVSDRFASITMTSHGRDNKRTEFNLEKADGTPRKLILEGGVLFELDGAS